MESKPRWGQCVPSGCSAQDVEMNFEALFEALNATGIPSTCETKHTQAEIKEVDGATIAVLYYQLFILIVKTLLHFIL